MIFFFFFFFFGFSFNTLSYDANMFCDVTSSALVVRRDIVLKEICPPGNYRLNFPNEIVENCFRYVI